MLKLPKKEWLTRFAGTSLESITNWVEYYYINPSSAQFKSHYQLWDEEWEQGGYNSDGEKIPNTTVIRSKNKIPVEPNTTYYMLASGGQCRRVFYDKDMNCIFSQGGEAVNTTFTTPANAYYMAFNTSSSYGGSSYKHDICINKSDASFNGKYEPYIIEIEDVIDSVKLKDLNWSYDSERLRFLVMFSDCKAPASSNDLAMIFCTNYKTTSTNELYSDLTLDRVCAVSSDSYLSIRDLRASSVDEFRVAMNGVDMLYLRSDSPL